jgi:alpha-glucosidase
MRQQVATVIGLGLSGVPFSGPDIGGFSGVPSDELYVRWLQMSVLLPYCRTHSVLGAPAREPWRFTEPSRSIIVAWLRFRYRLLPYLYTLAHDAATTGAPLVRPLWWPEPGDFSDRSSPADVENGTAGDDPKESSIDDAFLLGDALLVAPVTVPAATARPVILPPGQWISLWNDDCSGGDGGSTVSLAAPAGRTPVLVRVGSIVPLDDGWRGGADPCRLDADIDFDADNGVGTPPATALDLDHAPRQLSFHCWPTDRGNAFGACIDDAGDGFGPARRDRLHLVGATGDGSAVLTWERQGDFPPPAVVRVVFHGFTAQTATADGQPAAITGSSIECRPFSELRLEGWRPVGEEHR